MAILPDLSLMPSSVSEFSSSSELSDSSSSFSTFSFFVGGRTFSSGCDADAVAVPSPLKGRKEVSAFVLSTVSNNSIPSGMFR